ncbi:hypothetical protein LP419_33225 [Massilia sp. H-1]|nr:hypothetical protein LP419_33225 [Massilia sp. H-1]
MAGLLALTLCSPVFAARKLTFCFENRPVIPWRTMELDGLNFELLKRIEPKLDLYFQYQPLPWKRCLSKLQANEVDGAFTVSFSEDRRAFGVYPGHAAPGHAVPDAQKRMHTARYFLMRKRAIPSTGTARTFSTPMARSVFNSVIRWATCCAPSTCRSMKARTPSPAWRASC